MVLQCFMRSSRKYLGLTIGFYTAVDFVVILAFEESIFLAEEISGVFAEIVKEPDTTREAILELQPRTHVFVMRENEDISPLVEDGLTKNEFICR